MGEKHAYLLSAALHLCLVGLFFVPLITMTPDRDMMRAPPPIQVLIVRDKTAGPEKKQKQPPQSKPIKHKNTKVHKTQKKDAPSQKKSSASLPQQKKQAVPQKKAVKKEAKMDKAELKKSEARAAGQKTHQKDDFLAVLQTVEDLAVQPLETEAPQEGLVHPENLADVLSISELDALRQQLRACWHVPAGARGAEDLLVEIEIDVGVDREVKKMHLKDAGRAARDPFFQAAAESAKRALVHPHCTPLKLPLEKYESWSKTTITFNPREMLE